MQEQIYAKVRAFAEKNRMFDQCGAVAAGVSGGGDSVTMLDSEQTERRIRISDHSRSYKSRDPGRRGAKRSGGCRETVQKNGNSLQSILF